MFHVVYQTGGWAMYKWRHTCAYRTWLDAFHACEDVRRMGYVAFVELVSDTVALGMPCAYVPPKKAS